MTGLKDDKTKRLFFRLRSRAGWTLVEILAASLVLAAATGAFYSVFVTHWLALEGYTVRTQLWDEAGTIIHRMTEDGRTAKTINVIEAAGVSKTAVFLDTSATQTARYTIVHNGRLTRTDVAGTVQLSDSADFGNSSFLKNGDSLRIILNLRAPAFTREVEISTESEVFPRNYLN